MRERKLTNEQREQLLQAYLKCRRSAYDLAISLGVHKTYPAALAFSRGIKSNAPYIRGEPQLRYRDDHDDPRWAWARERGEVIAP